MYFFHRSKKTLEIQISSENQFSDFNLCMYVDVCVFVCVGGWMGLSVGVFVCVCFTVYRVVLCMGIMVGYHSLATL